MENTTVSEIKNNELDKTIHRERGKLLSFINGKMPSAEDAEDVLQDVFEEFAGVSGEVSTIENVASWLYRVARNKITDWYRKRKPERFENKQVHTDEADEPLLLADIMASMDIPADDKIMHKLILEQLSEALELMPAKQKDVFVMHELEGISLKQIAEITGTPIKTVISRKGYAVAFLREHLRELYNELIN